MELEAVFRLMVWLASSSDIGMKALYFVLGLSAMPTFDFYFSTVWDMKDIS